MSAKKVASLNNGRESEKQAKHYEACGSTIRVSGKLDICVGIFRMPRSCGRAVSQNFVEKNITMLDFR